MTVMKIFLMFSVLFQVKCNRIPWRKTWTILVPASADEENKNNYCNLGFPVMSHRFDLVPDPGLCVSGCGCAA